MIAWRAFQVQIWCKHASPITDDKASAVSKSRQLHILKSIPGFGLGLLTSSGQSQSFLVADLWRTFQTPSAEKFKARIW
jgi:hypothetical protein